MFFLNHYDHIQQIHKSNIQTRVETGKWTLIENKICNHLGLSIAIQSMECRTNIAVHRFGNYALVISIYNIKICTKYVRGVVNEFGLCKSPLL